MFETTFNNELTNLKIVSDKLRKANLKVIEKKCKLFKKEDKYLGHIVSDVRIKTD